MELRGGEAVDGAGWACLAWSLTLSLSLSPCRISPPSLTLALALALALAVALALAPTLALDFLRPPPVTAQCELIKTVRVQLLITALG